MWTIPHTNKVVKGTPAENKKGPQNKEVTMSVADFVRDLRAKTGCTGDQDGRKLARMIGIKDSGVIRYWEEGISTPKPETVLKITKSLKSAPGQYNAWMAMIHDTPAPPELVYLPYYEGGVNAGVDGRLPSDVVVDRIPVERGLLRQYGAVGDVIVFRLLGEADSMEPAIPRGSMVFVDTGRGKDRLAFQSGCAYAVAMDPDTREIAIKWVVKKPDGLYLVSANESYEPVKAWTQQLNALIVGLVIFYQGVPARKSNGWDQ